MDMGSEETKDKDSYVKFKIRGHLDCRRRGEGAAGPGLYFFITRSSFSQRKLISEDSVQTLGINRITVRKNPFFELCFL